MEGQAVAMNSEQTTREDSIGKVVEAVYLHGNHVSLDYHTDGDELHPESKCPDISAAIEQALKDERIRTLEAVGCSTFGISQCADHYSKQTSWCTRCRMLAEARGERQE